MTAETKTLDVILDPFLFEVPKREDRGKKYLICECCDRYILRAEMTRTEYVGKLNCCPQCYKQQRESLDSLREQLK